MRLSLPISVSLSIYFFLGAEAWGQIPKAYKTQEEYCQDNPKAPTCKEGKPVKMVDIHPPIYRMPNEPGGFKSYPNQAAYCRDNPSSPKCNSVEPMRVQTLPVAPRQLPTGTLGKALNLPPFGVLRILMRS